MKDNFKEEYDGLLVLSYIKLYPKAIILRYYSIGAEINKQTNGTEEEGTETNLANLMYGELTISHQWGKNELFHKWN